MSWHKRLLAADPEKREWYWSDPDTGKIALETEWLGVDGIVEDAKGSNNQFRGAWEPWKGTFNHIAYLPGYVTEYFLRHHKLNLMTDREALRWWLNNRDYSGAFRTRPGRV